MENKELNRLPLYFFNLKGLHLCGGFSSLAVSRDFFFNSFYYFCCLSTHRHLLVNHGSITVLAVALLSLTRFPVEPRKLSCSERVCACGFLPRAAVAWLQLPTQACTRFHREGRSWGEDEQGSFCALFCRTAAAEPLGSAQPPRLTPHAGYVCTDDRGKQKELPARCILKTFCGRRLGSFLTSRVLLTRALGFWSREEEVGRAGTETKQGYGNRSMCRHALVHICLESRTVLQGSHTWNSSCWRAAAPSPSS